MDHGVVSDGGLGADAQGMIAIHMQGAVVLDIASRTNRDCVPITADYGAKPYTDVIFDDHVTDYHGRWRDIHVIANGRHFAFVW
jgi:hypothetical protein